MSVLTVVEALSRARAAGVDRLDAHLLLAACMHRSRAWLIANDDAVLSDDLMQTFVTWLGRRASGEPLAYVLGEKEFHGLTLSVNSDVLVPRADTETLVDWALELLGDGRADSEVIDLGTGSGAIALAIKNAMPQARVTGVDKSNAALNVAKANGQRLELDVNWRSGHWWGGAGTQCFDLAVSNPPYIAEGDGHLASLSHEPRSALTAGADGLDDIRVIVTGAMKHLKPGAWLLLEHGHDQAEAVGSLLAAVGFNAVLSRKDLAGITRCTGARAPDQSQGLF